MLPQSKPQQPNVLDKSKRTFSKRVTVSLSLFGMGATIYSIYSGLGDVAIAGFAFLTTILTGYTTIGHLDYKKVLDTYRELNKDEYDFFDYGSELDNDKL